MYICTYTRLIFVPAASKMKFLVVLLLIGELYKDRIYCSKSAFNDTQLFSLQSVISLYCPGVTSLTCDGETEGIIASHCCSSEYKNLLAHVQLLIKDSRDYVSFENIPKLSPSDRIAS